MTQYPNLMPQLRPPQNSNSWPQPPRNNGSRGYLFRLIVLGVGIAVIVWGLTKFYSQIDQWLYFDYHGINQRIVKFAAFAAAIVGIVGLVKLILTEGKK